MLSSAQVSAKQYAGQDFEELFPMLSGLGKAPRKSQSDRVIEDVEQLSALTQDAITGTTENIEDTEVEQESRPVKDAKEYVVNNDVDDIVESTAVNKIAEKSSQQSAAGVPITNEEGESFTGHSSVKGNEFIFQVQDNLIVQKNLESAIIRLRKRNKGRSSVRNAKPVSGS